MKYSSVIIALLLAVISMTSWSCEAELFGDCIAPQGSIETRVVDLETIDAFGLLGSGRLIIKEGSEQLIEIRSYPNIIDRLLEDSSVRNGEWNIGLNGCVRSLGRNDLEIYATVASLTSISISGSGDVLTDGVFENIEDLDLRISGSGDMKLELGANVRTIETRTSGSGDYDLSGAAESLDITISGSGDLAAFDLITTTCDISISGSGDSEVNVEEELDIRISGSGDVCYRGNPTVNQNISGSGDVRDCN